MNLSSFYSAYTHLRDFYGVVLPDEEFESIAMHAWDKIGNKISRLYRYTGRVIQGELELPCNCDIIESVHSSIEDFKKTDNTVIDNYRNEETESFIESYRSQDTNPLYTAGKLINYQEGNGVIYINSSDYVTVVYKGVILDDEGLPSLNFKEVEAIAAYCAFVVTRKKGMVTRDVGTIQLSQALGLEWERARNDARNPIYLSQNDMNEILDVKTSWDRKRYGSSYKPMK